MKLVLKNLIIEHYIAFTFINTLTSGSVERWTTGPMTRYAKMANEKSCTHGQWTQIHAHFRKVSKFLNYTYIVMVY